MKDREDFKRGEAVGRKQSFLAEEKSSTV